MSFPSEASRVVDPFQPKGSLSLKFSEELTLTEDGGTATPTLAQFQPAVTLVLQDHDPAAKLYTVILSDPDAPNVAEPKFAEWQHWIQVNVSFQADGSVGELGESATEFFGPAPGKDTGKHRYCCVVYEQTSRIALDPAEVIPLASGFPARRSFNSRAFAARHSLQPIAALTFLAEYDDSVPDLAKKVAPPQ